MYSPVFCRVVVIPEGEIEPTMEWEEAYMGGYDEVYGVRPTSPEWEELASRLSSYANAERPGTPEIFLCLAGDQVEKLQESRPVELLVKTAQDHAWGAKIFLVASDQVRFSEELIDSQESFRHGMSTLLENRIADILQIDCHPSSFLAVSLGKVLRDARNTSRERLKAFRQIPSGGPWQCVVDGERVLLAQFLDELSDELSDAGGSKPRACNTVVVVDRSDEDFQTGVVERAMALYRGELLVSTLHVRPHRELLRFCREQGLKRPIHFRGELELCHLIQQLNSYPLPEMEERACRVVVDRDPVFMTERRACTLLLTNTLNRATDRDFGLVQLLEASKDVGSILRNVPPAGRHRVDPAAMTGRLVELIKDSGEDTLIWVHMGHGDGDQGLVDASGQWVAPHRWLDCFKQRHRRLALAVFLSCRSAEVARRFAEAGAGVTIGFEDEVRSDRARRVAIETVRAAVLEPGSRTKILDAFMAEYRMAETPENPSRPIAFYASR